MRYARNNSNFTTFADTRELFWKRLRLRGYPYHFLLPLFREVKYSNRNKWLKNSKRALDGKVVVFKTTYNCSQKFKVYAVTFEQTLCFVSKR